MTHRKMTGGKRGSEMKNTFIWGAFGFVITILLGINAYKSYIPLPFPLPIMLCPPAILLGGDSPHSFENDIALGLCGLFNAILYAFVSGFIRSRVLFADRHDT